jgi:diaminopropionate ammonia-lyase
VNTWYCAGGARNWSSPTSTTDAVEFHRTLPGYAATPLIDLSALADELRVGQVLVKDESSRLGLPAFKVLGASWACQQVQDRAPGVALVAATDGNHGRAVARMAAHFGVGATVFVPAVMLAETADRIAGEGASVIRVDGDYDEAVRQAAAHADEHAGRALVQDTAWDGYTEVPEWIVQGYRTLLHEVDAQLAAQGTAADLVAVPVGVGSLAEAVVRHYRQAARPRPRVLSIEPETAACVLASLHSGRAMTVPTADTVMAGLNCGTVSASASAWPVLRAGLDAAVAVTDDDALRAVADLGRLDVSSGPCGAATLAGVRAACPTRSAARRCTSSRTLSSSCSAPKGTPDDRSHPARGAINRDRLWASLMRLKEIGAYDDEATGLQGVRRLALTDADAEARRLCLQWMTEAGLEVRVDRIGNVYATRPGRDRSLPCVLMGSHIDLLAETAEDLGLPCVRAVSGAGHDAQEMAAICPTAMVFVAGENGGISHTPREYANPCACGDGTDVLANAVLRLANQR